MATKQTFESDFLSPPGDTLQDLLDERGMTQKELSERTGLTTKTVNEIVRGKAPISAETALTLETIFGIPARFWSQREHNYRSALIKMKRREALTQEAEWIRAFPYLEMSKHEWVPELEGRSKGALERRGLVLLNYFALKSPAEWRKIYLSQSVSFRRPLTFASNPEPLSAWLRWGAIEAERESHSSKYDKDSFLNALEEIRSLTDDNPRVFSKVMIERCAESGISLVFTPQVTGARVSGATRWLRDDRPLIQLSLRYKYGDHFWFTFFHEAAHILLHGKKDVFIDMEQPKAEHRDEKEGQADRWASDFLIPRRQYARFVVQTGLSADTIRAFAHEIRVAPGIIVGRLQHDGHLKHWEHNDLRVRYAWADK